MVSTFNKKILSIFLVLMFIFAACNLLSLADSDNSNNDNQSNQEEINTNIDDQNQSPNYQDTENNQNNSQQQDNQDSDSGPAIIGHAPLSTQGPWYVVSNPEGLYAFNMDGTGMTLLTTDRIHNWSSLSEGVSSSGGRIAYLTGEYSYENLILHVVDITNNLDHRTINLLSDYEAEVEPRRAIVELPSFAWSNDGQLLAFFGVIDGPSSDLYVYDPVSYETTRLTSGPSQGYQPVWSPDDAYIAHVGAESFGTGAGYNMSGVWAASADGSEVITLPLPTGSADEVILGWRDNDTFLSYSWSPAYGPYNLRFTNLFVGLAEDIWEYPFSDVGYGGPDDPWVLLSIDEYSASDNPAGLEGTYILEPPDYQPNLLFEDPGFIEAVGSSAFIVNTDESAYLIWQNTLLDITYLEEEIVISAQGNPAWYSNDGLWLQSGGEDVQVTDMSVELAAWGANAASIFFSVDGALFVATAPDWEPILVAALFFPEEMVLVMP